LAGFDPKRTDRQPLDIDPITNRAAESRPAARQIATANQETT
jgi:hypothetical protein